MPALGEETIHPDEPAIIAEFIAFLKHTSLERDEQNPTGQIPRFNQARATACVTAEFTVLDGLPEMLRVGLFAEPRTYAASIRFANATSSSDRDRDIRGIAISLAGVVGENLTPGATSQDFVLNSHPVMVAPDAHEFLQLLRANEAGGVKQVFYFATHPKAASIGLQSRKNPTCHFDIPYWSATPYRFGAGRAVKYVMLPTSTHHSTLPATLTDAYLRDAMRAHLRQADATFDFFVQLQQDSVREPIEDATVEWMQTNAPFDRVAQIRIPKQGFESHEQMLECEQRSFSPWHALTDHRPLGSMNRARREIYAAMSAFRASGGR